LKANGHGKGIAGGALPLDIFQQGGECADDGNLDLLGARDVERGLGKRMCIRNSGVTEHHFAFVQPAMQLNESGLSRTPLQHHEYEGQTTKHRGLHQHNKNRNPHFESP
jgi:hypothetical protein